MAIIDIDEAKKEVISWLDYKKIGENKRDVNKANIDVMANAIADGNLILNPETKVLTQQLKFPIGDEMVIKELQYRPRIDLGKVRKKMRDVTATAADDRIAVYICVLTSQSLDIIDRLDSEDQTLAQAIVLFFI